MSSLKFISHAHSFQRWCPIFHFLGDAYAKVANYAQNHISLNRLDFDSFISHPEAFERIWTSSFVTLLRDSKHFPCIRPISKHPFLYSFTSEIISYTIYKIAKSTDVTIMQIYFRSSLMGRSHYCTSLNECFEINY